MKKHPKYDEILQLLKSGVSQNEIERTLGVAGRVTKRIREENNIETEVKDQVNKQAKQDELSRLRSQVKALAREANLHEELRETCFGLARHTPAPPDWLLQPKSKSKYITVPNAQWSDWHWGEVVNRDEVDGFNEYNRDIAERRVKSLVEKTLKVCFDCFKCNDYPGIVVNLMGDMITGTIHKELADTNDRTTNEAILDLLDVCVGAISELAKHFPKVHIVGVVGNHARSFQKPQFKQAVTTSYDWLLYQLLERAFGDNENITFQIPNNLDASYQIFNTRYLVTHGDNLGVKGGDGFIGSIGPIRRGELKVRNFREKLRQGFDVFMIGHYHDYMELPGCSGFVNGSLIGLNEYGKGRRFTPVAPCQGLHFVDEHRLPFRAPIYLDDQPSKKGASWLTIP